MRRTFRLVSPALVALGVGASHVRVVERLQVEEVLVALEFRVTLNHHEQPR